VLLRFEVSWKFITVSEERAASAPQAVNASIVLVKPYNLHSRTSQLTKTNSVALVCERVIPTEPLPFIGEVSAKSLASRGVSHDQCSGTPTAVIPVFQTGLH
jgi:hypothetical protein